MISESVQLQPYNTFGICCQARFFTRFQQVDALPEILAFKQQQRINEVMILGGGSNLLFTKDYDGLVIKNEIGGIERIKEDDDHVWIQAGAGIAWHGLVGYCLEQQLAGIENLALIPGNVGASPMQNIGAYGVEIKDVFDHLTAFHIDSQTIQHFSNQDCAFGYRESVFKRALKGQYIILTVTFKLNKQPTFNTSYGAIHQELEKMGITTLSIQAIAQAVMNIRRSKLPDPAVIGNAGSFFKNPTIPTEQFRQLQQAFPAIVGYPSGETHTKVAAGWLIEQCGWKGHREGDAGCHAQQALVLVNYGTATGTAVYQLSAKIIESVQQKFGITLEREVNIL